MSKYTTVSSLESVRRAIKRLENFSDSIGRVPKEEMEKTARAIRAKGVAQAPYKSGKLERSVYARVVERNKNNISIHAGANAHSPTGYNYADVQHEHPEFNHPIKGKAYYIRDPFVEETNNLKKRMRRKMQVGK